MHVSRKVLRKFRSRSKTFSKCMFICCLLVVALFLCALFLSFLFKWIALCSSTSLTLSFLAYTFSCFKFFSSLLHPYLPLCTSHLVLNHQFQPYPLFLHFRSEYAGKCFFTCFSCISHNFSWLLTTWTASQVVHYDACTSYNPLWIPISFFSLSHISCSFLDTHFFLLFFFLFIYLFITYPFIALSSGSLLSLHIILMLCESRFLQIREILTLAVTCVSLSQSLTPYICSNFWFRYGLN